MRDHDDVPTIIIEKDSSSGLGSFVLGALVGAGVALLLAPRSGEETQALLRERALEVKGSAEEKVRDAQRQLEARLDEARAGVQSRVERVRDAVDAGREAARDARTDLEHKLETSKAAYRAGMEAARDVVSNADEEAEATG
jgi:gas vesicle protein